MAAYDRVSSSLASSYGTGTVHGTVGGSAVYGKQEWAIDKATITLERIFQSDASTDLFYAFASARLVNEGIMFWEEVEAFQNADWKPALLLGLEPRRVTHTGQRIGRRVSRSESQILTEGKRIYHRYLADDAEFQVCISSNMTETIEKQIFTGHIGLDIFREAQRSVFRDMEKGLFREFLTCLNHKGLETLTNAISENVLTPALATANAMRSVDMREFKMPNE